MKLIVALGNPGEKYKNTRHNVGFMALDLYLASNAPGIRPELFKKASAYIYKTASAIFAYPQTYMNNSGEAIKALVDFFKIDPEKNLLIIQDEIDLPFEEIRSSINASAAGHKGIKNIIDKLGTQNFFRLRIGIESREDKSKPETESFVLQNFTEDEKKKLADPIFPEVGKTITSFLS